MKRILPILLAVLICFTGTACKKKNSTNGSEKQPQQSSGTSVPIMTGGAGTTGSGTGSLSTTAPTNPTPQPGETDMSVFSFKDISVYLRSIEKDDYRTKFHFFVSNSGDLTLTVTLNILTINRYVFQERSDCDLIPCSAAIVSPYVRNDSLESAGISEITEIVLQISATDHAYNTLFDQTVTFTVEP